MNSLNPHTPESLRANNQSYEQYSELLGNEQGVHVQHQGLGENEYYDALADPRVATTDVVTETGQYPLPQLSPLDRFEWLNQDNYAQRFPEAYTVGNIMHFADFPGIEPGPEVAQELGNLAQRNGYIVFDYPSTDPEYVARVVNTLDRHGIKHENVDYLGSQTYFAAKFQLKREHKTFPEPLSPSETLARMTEEGQYDPSAKNNGVSLVFSVAPEKADEVNGVYERAFEAINDHPCQQGIDPQTFADLVTNKDDIGLMLYTKEGVVESMCMFSGNLSHFDWINPAKFEKTFPEESRKGQVLYFPAIATDPEKQGGQNMPRIVNFFAKLAENADNECVIAFDCCDKNVGLIDAGIEAILNSGKWVKTEMQTLGSQQYCAIKLLPK